MNLDVTFYTTPQEKKDRRDRHPQEDQRLIGEIKKRDQAAMGHLYDRYSSLVYSLALRVLKDAPEAQEIVTQTFWQVWRQAERYDSARGDVLSWIMSIARSRALDARRTRARCKETENLEDFTQITAPRIRPDETVWITERRSQVMQALSRLPESQQVALELAYFEGLTHSEIAKRTGEPLGTVKTRIRLGLLHLREQLESSHDRGRVFQPFDRLADAWMAWRPAT